jgi:hypothetical protein
MEYWQEEGNRIASDFALRTGKLVYQYDAFNVPKNEKYECTLYTIALASLLLQCKELYYAMGKNAAVDSDLKADLFKKPHLWGGIGPEHIEGNFEYEKIEYGKLFVHIRNALAHPTVGDEKGKYPKTGFTTIPDKSQQVTLFHFVTSPILNKYGDPKSFSDERSARNARSDHLSHRNDIKISKVANRYKLTKDGEPFAPSIHIKIPISIMRELVLRLSNFLGQPAQKHWDGKTINELITKE